MNLESLTAKQKEEIRRYKEIKRKNSFLELSVLLDTSENAEDPVVSTFMNGCDIYDIAFFLRNP